MLRRLVLRAVAVLAALGPLGACAAPARAPAQACEPVRVAEAALHAVRNFLLVQAALNGRPATLLVDTGAEVTTLTPQAVAALRLPGDPAHARTLAGITGNVRSSSVKLGGLALGGRTVASSRSVAIGALPSLEGVDPPVAGLLGTDVLAGYEVELDLPDGRMALYAASPCAGWRPWPGAVPVPFQRSHSGLALLDVQVDGRAVRALLDTGARTSLLTRQTALALGVTAPMLAADEPRTGMGVGAGSADFRQHRFAALALPGASERDVPINVADLRLPGVEMLLGADFLGPRHLWISYATNRLFLR